MPKVELPQPRSPSAWQCHVARWGREGCGSALCERANLICLGRGTVPADVLFVGEAPGQSEDTAGIPFVGPAGQLLDKIVAASVPCGVTCCFTNLTGCIPLDADGAKDGEPDDASVKACAPRLRELAWICDPKLVVCVGDLARDWLDPKLHGHVGLHLICDQCRHAVYKFGTAAEDPESKCRCVMASVCEIPQVAIHHPARILRSPTAAQGMMATRCRVAIANAVEEFITGVS